MTRLARRALARLLAAAVAFGVVAAPAPTLARQGATSQRPVTVTATGPLSGRAYLGDAFGYRITVDGSRDVAPPAIPSTADYDIEFLSNSDESSFSAQIVNGQMTTSQILRRHIDYAVRPKSLGSITIPPVEVAVAGDATRYATPAVTVRITEPAASADTSLELAADPPSDVYVGQPIRLTLTWTLAVNIRAFAFDLPELPDGFELHALPDPRPPNTPANDPRFITAQIAGQSVVGVLDRATRAGRDVVTVRFDLVVVPHEPGRFTLGPARVDFNAVVRERPRTLMDAPWDDTAVTERQAARSKPLSLTVKPLPEEGRPADFTGLVGSYALFADATPREVSIGEPIDLTVRVIGPQPLSLVPPLDLTRQPLAAGGQFRVPRDPLLQAQDGGRGASYHASIRARTADLTHIPPIELPYFDPVSATYKTARSQPIPITVKPTESVTLGGEPGDLQPETPALDAPPAGPGGLVAVTDTPIAWDGPPFDLAARLRDPMWASAIALPPLACFSVAAVVAIRARAARNPAATRRRRAIGRAKTAVRRAARGRSAHDPRAEAAAISAALRTCAADLDGLPPDALTSRQAIEAVERHAGPGAADFRAALEACDHALFGAASTLGQTDAPSLSARAVAALNTLSTRRASR